MPKLPPDHGAKRADALRANLLKRKAQDRAREDGETEKPLKTENAPVKDSKR